ncbi:MAG: calcium-binding protein [Cyanobacteria bacterium P01_F01_bin.86]
MSATAANQTTPIQLAETLVLEDGDRLIVRDDLVAPVGEPAVTIAGDEARLTVTGQGSLTAPDAGNSAVEVIGDEAQITNRGLIAGALNGITSIGNDLFVRNFGQIESDSRVVDLSDGDGSVFRNFGTLLGTGNQRNGTLYVDGTVDDLAIFNSRSGIIDAAESNLGDGISVQVGASGDLANENIDIANEGLIQGRGDGPEVFAEGGRVAANGSSGLRFFNGSGTPEVTLTGSVVNGGTITAEVNVGFLGGVVVEDGVAFEGRIVNRRQGVISGPRNGLYIGNAEHDLDIFNSGLIASGSRVVNLDGDNVSLTNRGDILGTDNQRNGTVYIDGTGDNITIDNQRSGVVDAGESNLGDGISVQVGASGDPSSEDINILNSGFIQGRGDGPEVFADGGRVASNGSSGVRFFNGSGTPEAIVTGSVINDGTITAEVNVGFLGGVVVEDGVGFRGRIENDRHGLISGPRNGLYIGNANHDLEIVNSGRIESGSRVVNLDGDGVSFRNAGEVIGTGNQRNGTIYVDGTADDLDITNTRRGVIDAGEGNLGDGIAVQVGASGDPSSENINIVNSGLIQGRGDGPDVFADGGRVASNGSSGVRFFNGSGTPEATLTGSIVNNGTITAEVNVGFLGGVVIEDGIAFDGAIVNERRGVIAGPRNGLYIGNAEHDLTIVNEGRIESGSRAVNLDGSGVSLFNSGDIVGTDNQRNGTVYIDATIEDFSIVNQRGGVVDAGEGNLGTAISLQVGEIDGDVVQATLINDGLLQGRGDGTGNLEGDGIRITSGATDGATTLEADIENQRRILATDDGIDLRQGITLAGDILNQGTIVAEDDGVVIEGRLTGTLQNTGTITGGDTAINAVEADAGITVNNRGTLNGDVLLSQFDDVFDASQGRVNGIVDGGGGDDQLIGTQRRDTLLGGEGDDTLTGGRGNDTFVFAPTDFGDDTVTDFQVRNDLLDLSDFGFGVSDITALLNNAQQLGGDTLLAFTPDNTVLLQDVQANTLDVGNFVV